MARTTGAATDLITFSRASSGTALTKVAYGPELVTNGGFDTDLTGWETTPYGTALDWSVVNGQAVCQTSTGLSIKTQAISVEIGSYYEVSGNSDKTTELRIGSTTNFDSGINIGSNNGNFVQIIQATNVYLIVAMRTDTNGTFYWDNISVRKVTYNSPTGTLKLISHPTNKPRVEYDANGVAKGLLIEEARTNLVTYSQDFNGVAWQLLNSGAGAVPVLTPNYALSPDGTNNAYRLQASAGGTNVADYSLLQQTFSNTTVSPTSSVWVKSNTGAPQDFYYRIYGTDQTSTFQATTEWQRFSITSPQPNTLYFTIGARGTATGTSAVDILIYGPQLEEGSFPTSYIPTSGATATRSADIASIVLDRFAYNNSQGTVVAEATPVVAGGTIINISDIGGAGSVERMQLRFQPTSIQAVFASGGAANGSSTLNHTPKLNVPLKTAWAFSGATDLVVAAGGTIGSLDSSFTTPNPYEIRFGRLGSTEYLNAYIKSVKYYPVRLDDDKLKELTL